MNGAYVLEENWAFWLTLAWFDVRDPCGCLPATAIPLDRRFADGIRLVGWEARRLGDDLDLALYWRAFTAWFRSDDFAWLGTGIYIQNFHDLVIAIFAPQVRANVKDKRDPILERRESRESFPDFAG